MKVKFKKLNPKAHIPTKAHPDDAGYDLYACNFTVKHNPYRIIYDLGIALEIPKNYVGLVYPRSSICKTGLSLSNSVGVIDSNYRGSISAVFYYSDKNHAKPPKIGERVAQLIIMPYPEIEFEESDELSDTDRGANGYGSSGK